VVFDAPWVSSTQARGARAFEHFLLAHVTPAVAAQAGFRPGGRAPPTANDHGPDPAIDLREPRRLLPIPTRRVLAAIRRAWRLDRKPADILLVVDVSASMGRADRLDQAKVGLRGFLREAAPQDSIGLTTFSDRIRDLLSVRPVSTDGRRLVHLINGLVAEGSTALYDATAAAVRHARAAARPDRITAVVVLTDGMDASSRSVAQDVIDRVRTNPETTRGVRVFTIAYSPDARRAQDVLRAIADASGGNAYTGTTDDIVSIYREIASFF
jgi:Ca-activated chloride channel family protein